MSAIPPNALVTILDDVLDACIAAYSQTGAPTVPSRAYVTHGQPVVEGEQLTVQGLGISTVHPFPLAQLRAVRTTIVGSAGISIEVWRACWPTPQATSHASRSSVDPGAFTAAAEALLLDAATIWGWLSAQVTSGTLIPSIPTIQDASDIALQPMTPLGPSGMNAGWRIPISVKLSIAMP